MVKTTTVQKIWMGKTTTIQVFDHMTKNLDSSRISIPFWPGMTLPGQTIYLRVERPIVLARWAALFCWLP